MGRCMIHCTTKCIENYKFLAPYIWTGYLALGLSTDWIKRRNVSA